jgi:Putative prokaryotic signal transducing protein
LVAGDTHDLKIVTSVSNEPEAAMVCDLLSQAGIGAIQKQSSGVGSAWSGAGVRDVYVEEQDLDRAREVLNVGGISEEELTREEEMAERATQLTQPEGKDTDGNRAEPIEIPVPKVSTFRAAIRKVAQPLRSEPPND